MYLSLFTVGDARVNPRVEPEDAHDELRTSSWPDLIRPSARDRRAITGSSPVMTIEKEIVIAVLGLDPRINPAIARRLPGAAWNFLSSLE
jgi:hypothetical protein